ncbi:MAG: hypothetical protein ABW012_07470, partial [Gaiellaceae bacterium]
LPRGADSDSDSRLGTDGNQPRLELREGAADDAALLIPQIEIRSRGSRSRGSLKTPLTQRVVSIDRSRHCSSYVLSAAFCHSKTAISSRSPSTVSHGHS